MSEPAPPAPPLSKAQLLDAADTWPRDRVDLPGDGHVYVRSLSSAEVDAYQQSLAAKDGKPAASPRAKLVALCACDGAGKRLFTDDDAGELGRRNAKVIARIFEAALKLNGIGGEAEEQAEKN